MTFEGPAHSGFNVELDHLSQDAEHSAENVKRRLIVALDMPDVEQARALVNELGDAVNYYKVGLELLFAGGLAFAKELRERDMWVFLDMKLLDIENTVEKAVANIAKLDFQYLTVHGLDTKTLNAARHGKGDSNLGLLAVTVLTNLDARDLLQQGIERDPASLVVDRAKLAYGHGFDGVIASGHEAKAVRRATDRKFIIKTPGIRLPGMEAGDQKRVISPAQAIASGADYIVVGRPIVCAEKPREAAERFVMEIDCALKRDQATLK